MKSTSILVLATGVAAKYGYGASSTSTKIGYTTIHPGHGKQPVTVTSQYQPVPTYVNGQWSEYEALSSVITNVRGKNITVTAAEEVLTIYHKKKTITHTVTMHKSGYAKPTGYPRGWNSTNATNNTTRQWKELREEIHEVSYNHVGPHAIPGYSGNPRCKDNPEEQVVLIKKYSHGTWHTYNKTFTYRAPKPTVTIFPVPGTFTIPANDITVEYPTSVAIAQTSHAIANKPITYGGQTTDVTKPGTITAPYAAYETKGSKTQTVIRTKTITCDKPGKYTVVQPTTTVYSHDTAIVYPSVTGYSAGVYHHPAETVTITKPHQAYTCSYQWASNHALPTLTPVRSSPTYDSEEGSGTHPSGPDPSSDHEEPLESYGHAEAGYIKRGGVFQRRSAEAVPAKPAAKFVILL